MKSVECKECGNEVTILTDLDTECRGCHLAKKRVYFEFRWECGGGFMKHLCDAITVADYDNLEKIHRGYPELVDGYCVYSRGKELKECLESYNQQ